MTLTRLSVVICAYTSERWERLHAAVHSVLEQDRQPDELLVVADHCPSRHSRAAQAFGPYGVRVVVAYGVRDPARLGEDHRGILLSALALLTLPAGVPVVLAPLVLSPFGDWYASQGSTTVRLLALSTLPNAVVALTVSRARVARQMSTVVSTMVGLCCVVLGLTWVLLLAVGIAGAAVAWLVGELAVTAAIAINHLRRNVLRLGLRDRRDCEGRTPKEKAGNMVEHQQSSGLRVDDGPGERDELLVVDLLASPEQLSANLGLCLEAGQWLDAYLLSAGLLQVVDDRLHPDPLQLRRVAAFLRGSGQGWARLASPAMAPCPRRRNTSANLPGPANVCSRRETRSTGSPQRSPHWSRIRTRPRPLITKSRCWPTRLAPARPRSRTTWCGCRLLPELRLSPL